VCRPPLLMQPCLAFQYHINKLSIMSSENHLNNSDKDVDEVDAALSDLEITLEGGKTSTILVRAVGMGPDTSPPRLFQAGIIVLSIQSALFPSSPVFVLLPAAQWSNTFERDDPSGFFQRTLVILRL